MYGEFLRSKGWTAFSAPDGRTGLDKATDLKPDVVILDLAMPRVDGWTVLKHLRESSWTSPIPVIVLTALSEMRDEAFHVGCDAYLVKPCPPEVVWLQIQALFRYGLDARLKLDRHQQIYSSDSHHAPSRHRGDARRPDAHERQRRTDQPSRQPSGFRSTPQLAEDRGAPARHRFDRDRAGVRARLLGRARSI